MTGDAEEDPAPLFPAGAVGALFMRSLFGPPEPSSVPTHTFTQEGPQPERDIIDAIDEALACQAEGCSQPIPEDGPLTDFCSSACWHRWHESRCDLPSDYVPAEYDEWAYVRREVDTPSATIPVTYTPPAPGTSPWTPAAMSDWTSAWVQWSPSLASPLPAEFAGAFVAPNGQWWEQWVADHPNWVFPGGSDDAEPVDPMQRALEARRNRNTGPAQRQRPPRVLGPGRRW